MGVAELLEANDSTVDIKRHEAFRYLYNQQKDNVNFDEEEWESSELAQKALRDHTLKMTHVVITTTSNVVDHSLYFAFNPALIVLNKADRLLKADIWNLWRNYKKIPFIMIKYENQITQLRSMIISISENNDFLHSMKISRSHCRCRDVKASCGVASSSLSTDEDNR